MSEYRIPIRSIAAALALAAWGVSTTAHAAPWCGTYRNGSTNCGFSSQEQCQAAMSGSGGFCNRSSSESGARNLPRARSARPSQRRNARKKKK